MVVLVHGFKGYKDWAFFPWLAEFLAGEGLAVCRFDSSRCGISEGSETFDRLDLFENDTYSTQIADLKAVIDRLRADQATANLPIAVFGHSRGGAVSLITTSEDPEIRAVATWAAIATTNRWDEKTTQNWRRDGRWMVENTRTKQIMPISTRLLDDWEQNRVRFDVMQAVGRVTQPLLVVHGTKDETVHSDDARQIVSVAREGSNLLLIEGASHTFGAIHPLLHVPMHLKLAAEVTASFFRANARRVTSG